MNAINILSDEGIINKTIIEGCEKKFGYLFPDKYKNLISKHNGLYPKKDTFKYFDEVIQKDEENGIYFYAFANENLRSNYCDGIVGDFSYLDEEDFEKGIIPFAGTPNGDFICFDYRDNLESDNPKIVLVHHDADDENGNLIISFLGNNFEEFMDLLYEY